MMARPLPLACAALALFFFGGCVAPAPATRPDEIIGLERDTPKPVPAPAPAQQKKSGAPSIPPPLPARRVWTVAEVQDWYPAYLKSEPSQSRGLMYQGSDQRFHYFVARISTTKTWLMIAIAKTELRMPEEKPDRTGSNPPHGHGFVDPMNDFRALPRGTKP